MRPRVLRPVRALRVLLACVFLFWGASACAPRRAWNDDVVVLVAQEASREAESRDTRPRSSALASFERAALVASRPREAGSRRPARDLYLRNCVLLC